MDENDQENDKSKRKNGLVNARRNNKTKNQDPKDEATKSGQPSEVKDGNDSDKALKGG